MQQRLDESQVFELHKFLETGCLGYLSAIPTIDETYRILGQPLDTEQSSEIVRGNVFTRLYYGNLEIRYINEQFYQLVVYFRSSSTSTDIQSFPQKLGATWYDCVSKMGFQEIKNFLQSNKVNCRRIIFPVSLEDDVGLSIEVVATGIHLNFSDYEKIDCIHYTPSRDGKYEYMSL